MQCPLDPERNARPLVLLIALLVAAAAGAVSEASRFATELDRMRTVAMDGSLTLGQIIFHAHESRRGIASALASDDPRVQQSGIEASRTADQNVRRLTDELARLGARSGLREALAAFRRAWTAYGAERDGMIGLILEDRALSSNASAPGAPSRPFDDAYGALRAIQTALDREAAEAAADANYALIRTGCAIGVIVAGLLAAAWKAANARGRQAARSDGVRAEVPGATDGVARVREELEQRVDLRTNELKREIEEHRRTQAELMRAKQEAESSNRAKSTFLANMSHELRTPLNAVIGYSDLLREECESAGQEGYAHDLGRIHMAGTQLLRLINDILDLSKIEAGQMTVAAEAVPAGAALEDSLAAVESLAQKNKNRLSVDCADPSMLMLVDPHRFRQSLVNLLSNACKFTSDGEVSIRVTRREEDGREWVDWRVADTGIGIAPNQIPELFQPFSQADESSTRRFGGTGLGLAVTQRLCELMGGRIQATSELGKGSVFTISVPAADQLALE